MTDTKDNSSLPLLLSITGAVVAVAVGGWFLLKQPAPTTDELVPTDAVEVATENEPESSQVAMTDDEELNVDGELRKARLAADAEILVLPTEHSAAFYYGRVLSLDPENAIAKAELDAVFAKVALDVSQLLAAEDYAGAYEIAVLVAKQAPEHALVIETQTTLDALTEDMVQQAISFAQEGDDEQADEFYAAALALPGRNPKYFSAISDSIAEIRSVREAATRDRQERADLAADDARKAWVARTLAAIDAGNLITPAGASARDLLAERNYWTTERARLTDEFRAALLATAMTEIDSNQLASAENLLNVATELSGDPGDIDAVRASLENALVAQESNRAVPVSDLVRVKAVAAVYPKRALERGVTGWVDVYFTVMPGGETASIEIADSDPKKTFDRAAIRAVTQWAFEPVEFRGQIISQRAAARLVFQLE